MDCPNCGTANPVEAKFCMSCGSSFEKRCPECSQSLPTDATFCFNCGTRIGEDDQQMLGKLRQYIPEELLGKLMSSERDGQVERERRIVTMLFSDVKGSTAAAESLDPEDWAELIEGAFEHLITPIYRYEGTLARLMGDAILAFFGAPISHEDDPERAVLAGLDILREMEGYAATVKQRWDVDFAVRVGINTGLVVVGEVGSDLRVEYTALGDAVNVAARMEQTAAPGTVQITESTHRRVAARFEFEELGPVDVKGKSDPVMAYRVVRPRTKPPQQEATGGMLSPLVGRDGEMGRLQSMVEGLQAGRGRVASIMGEAGLGKSRLLTELRNSIETEGSLDVDAAPSWAECSSNSYEKSTPFAPAVRLFNDWFGIADRDSHEERYRRVRSSVESDMGGHEAERVVPYMCALLDIPLDGDEIDLIQYLDPPELRARIFEACSSYLVAVAAARPLVLVFDDLHWADTNTTDLVLELMRATEIAPLLLLGLFRPRTDDPSWRFHEIAMRELPHRYESIVLDSLDAQSAIDLLENLAGDGYPPGLRELILEKADGNPLFVEEVLRSLLDSGVLAEGDGHSPAVGSVGRLAVPDSLAAVLVARLDQLPEDARAVIQAASILGRRFRFETLEAIVDQPVDVETAARELLRRGVIEEVSRLPERVYAFKHALMQEVAHESLLRSKRRRLHGIAGEWIERHRPEDVNEIARHLLETEHPARALPFLVAAGEAAADAYSIPEAVDLFEKAIELSTDEEDLELARDAHEGLGRAHLFANRPEAAIAVFDGLLRLGEQRDDLPTQVSALNKLGFTQALRIGDVEEGERCLTRAKGLAEQAEDNAGLAEFHETNCFVNVNAGRLEEAVRHQLEAARISGALGSGHGHAFGLAHYAETLTFLTRYDQAADAIDQAREAAEAAGAQQFLALVEGVPHALYLQREGDIEGAAEASRRGTELAARIGAAIEEAMCGVVAGHLALSLGSYEQALTLLSQADKAGERSGLNWARAAVAALRSTLSHALGSDAATIAGYHESAADFVRRPLGQAAESAVWAELASCALHMGNIPQADDYLDRGLNARSAFSLLFRPQLLALKAQTLAATGQVSDAEERLAEGLQFARERQMKHVLPLLDLSEGLVRSAAGDHAAWPVAFEKADAAALQLGMKPLALEARIEAARAGMRTHSPTADESRSRALELLAEVAAGFADPALADSFNRTETDRITSGDSSIPR